MSDNLVRRWDVFVFLTEYYNHRTEAQHDALKEALSRVPSAEPEIIRCKDCKWFGKSGCSIEIVDDSDKPKEDDFCSFAERKEDG